MLNAPIILPISVKSINNSLGCEGLLPSVLVCRLIPTQPVACKPLSTQKERMASKSLAGSEIETIPAELRISKASKSKLPPTTEV